MAQLADSEGQTQTPAAPILESFPEPSPSKLSGRAKCGICCGATLVVLLVVGALGLFVFGPMVAKSAMANSIIRFDTLGLNCVVKNQSMMVSSNITISNVKPLGCTIAAMTVDAIYKGRPFGKLQMPAMTVKPGVDNHISTPSSPVTITDEKVWDEASSAMLRSDSVTWQLKSKASVTSTVMGISHTFHGVPFDKEVSFKGFNAFEGNMKVRNLDATGGKNGIVDMAVDAEVTNPSNIVASLGPLMLEMWTISAKPVKLGEMHLADFALNGNPQGSAVTKFSKVKATYSVPPPSSSGAPAARAFLSKFALGKDQKVMLRGTAASSPMRLMKQSLVNFTTFTVVPGLVKNRLLSRSVMHLPNPLSLYDVPTQLLVQNPFSADMLMTGSHCDIFPCKKFRKSPVPGTNPGTCDEYYSEPMGYYSPEPIHSHVPGNGQLGLPFFTVKLYKIFDEEFLKTALASLGRGSLITLKGNVSFSIGEVPVTVDYHEEAVPICLEYPTHHCKGFLGEGEQALLV